MVWVRNRACSYGRRVGSTTLRESWGAWIFSLLLSVVSVAGASTGRDMSQGSTEDSGEELASPVGWLRFPIFAFSAKESVWG